MKPDGPVEELYVVLGMHRSGTSAITRGLQVLGVELGDHLEPPAAGVNDKGYWEDIDIVKLNVEMMAAIGLEWHSLAPLEKFDVERLRSMGYLLRAVDLLRQKLSSHPRYGFKDPRTARMLPFWMEAFALGGIRVQYVLAIRNPLSVVKSLGKRNGFAPEKSYLLWVVHIVDSLVGLRGKPAVIVDYDEMMRDPDRQFELLARCLGVAPQPDRLQIYKTDFLDVALQHTVHRPEDLRLDIAAPPLAYEIYSALLGIAAGRVRLDDPAFDEKVTQWATEVERLKSLLRLSDKYDEAILLARQSAADHIERLELTIKEAAARSESLEATIANQREQLSALEELVREREKRIADLALAVETRDHQIGAMAGVVADRESRIASLGATIAEIRASTSWRVTAPLRLAGTFARFVMQAVRFVPGAVRSGGGWLPAAGKALRILRGEGFAGIPRRIRSVRDAAEHGAQKPVQRSAGANAGAPAAAPPPASPASMLAVLPYYVDPRIDERVGRVDAESSIAVHLHLFYREMLGEFTSRLASLPADFDLFVSVQRSCDRTVLEEELRAALPRVRQIVIEAVPNRGRDIGPLIVQFGERLAQYDIIGHFHTKKSAHNDDLADWRSEILDILLGKPGNAGGRIAHIVELLQSDAKVVYPEGSTRIFKDPSGWADNLGIAAELLQKHSTITIGDFASVEFPEGAMFWARANCLRGLLCLPLSYEDFEPEPIPADGTLAHAIERLVLVFASRHKGRCYRIHQGDSIPDYRHYEEQQDYSSSVVHGDVRILAYYLPQFHPIPENDLWHGEGFTEWTKVRAANPLFEGHYQQHIPHPDIGYYRIDSPEILRRQAEMMRRAGVHGLVFYHYSFGGRRILDAPAHMLLEHADIALPFCFCWANENWTRRWDGNESEVLLAQEYSRDDARSFIQYLIPFFQDARYIKVDGRPVLFIYRAASIPNVHEYLDIWQQECAGAGIERPYVVAVLTRGASDPRAFGMDAGVERPLHDWTAGAVPECKTSLRAYGAINGSVLPYDEVAGLYAGQSEVKEYTYFRSLVPIWDNTARYGTDAYLVHGSTPQGFEEWLRACIAYANASLPADRRFVVVNAWNEWAEGAHLEPDSRYGYSYLNSVGRALSDIPYGSDLNPTLAIPAGLTIFIDIAERVQAQLRADADLLRRFTACLERSTLFRRCRCILASAAANLFPTLPCSVASGPGNSQLLMDFRRVAFFDPTVLERMVQTACCSPGSVVIPNCYNASDSLFAVTANGSVESRSIHSSPVVLRPARPPRPGYKNCRMRTDAHCFAKNPDRHTARVRPHVTTIIRFHKGASMALLQDALYSLAAMRDCIVVPLIAAQDLSELQQSELMAMLDEVPFAAGVSPQVHHYRSPDGAGDLRARMLNESLHKVKTQYAAFLDYDDLLTSDAYAWLIERLERTGKAVAFGCVYVTTYDVSKGLWLERKRIYEGRYSFDEFRRLNNMPLHSFMLDLDRLDLSHIVYHDDQRYMEDYFLTLQLFKRDNVDWESLALNRYIGDYIHSVDRTHTLAFTDDAERQALLRDPEYVLCEARINELRRTVQ